MNYFYGEGLKKMKRKIRLDIYLVENMFVASIEKARSFIMQGKVLVDDKKQLKPGEPVHENVTIRVLGEEKLYVSRGGLKLAGAISDFSVNVAGKIALDVGVSTGGFSDYLLQNGIQKVIGIDVGYGQVAQRVSTHKDSIIFERLNVRHLTTSLLGEKLMFLNESPNLISSISLFVMDLSFISILSVLPVLKLILSPGAEGIVLVKPQFEASSDQIGDGGIVRDVKEREAIFKRVCENTKKCGFELLNTTVSPIKGIKGNTEYFIHIRC
jgi:23S rRNA (cytidine1920-2'-O)/16S rRNA (cytidine1409-2'-O)-methyltransferase